MKVDSISKFLVNAAFSVNLSLEAIIETFKFKQRAFATIKNCLQSKNPAIPAAPSCYFLFRPFTSRLSFNKYPFLLLF